MLRLRHLDGNLHTQFIASVAEIGAGQRRRLSRIARHRDADEVLAADQPIRRIEFDPARADRVIAGLLAGQVKSRFAPKIDDGE